MKRSLLAGLVAVLVAVGTGFAMPAATTLTVMTLNIWHTTGSGLDTVAAEIRRSGANVVALQETSTADTTGLAQRLGWYHTPTGWDIDVISALPIERSDWDSWPDSGGQAIAAKIAGVWVYSVHLDYTRYGPYNACFDRDSLSTILADEANRRRQASQIAAWTGSSPAILGGDLNSPSHQDWTEANRAAHCGYAVEWPTTKAFTDRGFADPYRALNSAAGETWSPVVKTNPDNGRPEPQDRIDYVLSRGVRATSSRTFGGGDNWPSDHLAVITQFTV